jgi:hypothetical protein
MISYMLYIASWFSCIRCHRGLNGGWKETLIFHHPTTVPPIAYYCPTPGKLSARRYSTNMYTAHAHAQLEARVEVQEGCVRCDARWQSRHKVQSHIVQHRSYPYALTIIPIRTYAWTTMMIRVLSHCLWVTIVQWHTYTNSKFEAPVQNREGYKLCITLVFMPKWRCSSRVDAKV